MFLEVLEMFLKSDKAINLQMLYEIVVFKKFCKIYKKIFDGFYFSIKLQPSNHNFIYRECKYKSKINLHISKYSIEQIFLVCSNIALYLYLLAPNSYLSLVCTKFFANLLQFLERKVEKYCEVCLFIVFAIAKNLT